jgi:hypothetical protein
VLVLALVVAAVDAEPTATIGLGGVEVLVESEPDDGYRLRASTPVATARAGAEITGARAVGVGDADRKQGDRPGEHEGRRDPPAPPVALSSGHPGSAHSVRMSP